MPGPLSRARPVAFLSITDRKRSRAFYAETLGLGFAGEDGYALVFDLGRLILRLTLVEKLTPQPFTVLGWQVGDIEETVRRLATSGIALERYDELAQDALGTWTSPSGARVAWFKDPDGNLLAVTQTANR